MYQLVKNPVTNAYAGVFDPSGNLFIPFDPANTDYQEYLRWIEQGNAPHPAKNIEGS